MQRLRNVLLTSAVFVLLLALSACGSSSDGSLVLAPTTASTLAPPTTAPRSTLPLPVATSSTTTTIGEYASSPNGVLVSNLTLRDDGIGPFHFDDTIDAVRSGLIASLGAPTEPDEVIGADRADCDLTPSTIMHWGSFQVGFVGEGAEATLTGYDLFGAPTNAGLTSPGGVTVGLSYDQVSTILGGRPPIKQGTGALVLAGLPPGSPVVEIAGSAPTDPVSRIAAGDLPTCGLPPDDGTYE